MTEFDKIAVIGERKIAMGFEMIGIQDIFISDDPKEMLSMLRSTIASKEYGLIIASDSIMSQIYDDELRKIEAMLKPVVIFIPISKDASEKESVAQLAKRVLGIDISNLKNK